MSQLNLKDKLQSIYVEESEFTPDGQSQPIVYKRLVLEVSLDGEFEKLEFVPSEKLGKAGYTLLRVADDVKKTVASQTK